MAYHITLQPGGKSFLAEPNETILDAALRSGINLDYHCSNGSCGACLARVRSGKVVQARHHDYVCKPASDGCPQILSCCSIAGSDLVLEARESGRPQDVPLQSIETKVYKLEKIDDHIMLLQLRTPRSQTLRFLAGQYVSLNIKGLPPRSKSIASCPCNGMYLQFHVHASEHDGFSDYVFNTMKPRETVMLNGPSGQFNLDDDSNRPILFIANDTGFAPIKSLIEHAISLELEQAMYLYWNMPENSRHYLENYCRAWEDALDNFTYIPLHSDSRTLDTLSRTIIEQHPDLSGFDVYLNGPEQNAQAILERLQQHGLAGDRSFIDKMKKY